MNLINDEIKLSRIKSKVGPSCERKPGTKNKMTLDKLTKIVTDGFANVNHRIDNLDKVNNLKE